MEIMLSPAINLISSVLLNFKVYGRKDLVVTGVIPEIFVEGFFREYENFDIDTLKEECETPEDIKALYPEIYRAVFREICEEIDFGEIDYAEILWAIDMGLPPGIPAYIAGYEIK